MKKKTLLFVSLMLMLLFVSCSSISFVGRDYEPEDPGNLINPFRTIFWVDAGDDPIGVEDSLSEALQTAKLIAFPISERQIGSNGSSLGTCFAISSNLLLTNQHVINEKNKTTILIDGRYEPVTVIYQDTLNDIALLKTDSVLPYYFAMEATENVLKGDYVCVLGYPLANLIGTTDCTMTEGIISNLTGLEDNPLELQISAPIQNGNSGSPVLNREYHVIGMVSSTLSDEFLLELNGQTAQNVNFAKKSDLLNLVCSIYNTESDSEAKTVTSLDEAEKAVFSVFAEDSIFQTPSDYGYDEYLIRVRYGSSWNSGVTYYYSIDNLEIEIINKNGELVFSGEYYPNFWAGSYTRFIDDLATIIDQSTFTFGVQSDTAV